MRISDVPASAAARAQSGVARLTARGESEDAHSLIGQDWIFTAPAIVIAAGLALSMTAGAPCSLGCVGLQLAIVVVAASRMVLRFETRFARSISARFGLMMLTVGMPMFGAGIAFSSWARLAAERGGLVITVPVFIVAIVAVVSLQSRLPSIVGALTGLVSGMTILTEPTASLSVMTMSLFAQLVLVRRFAQRVDELELGRIERERLQQRAEALLSEYEQTGQGWFWETDRRGAITYVSPHIARLLRAKPAALAGKPFTSMFRLDAGESDSERTLMFHLSTRSSFQDLSVQARTDEDEERWWSISGRPVLDPYNNFMGFRGSGSDLTETRRSQRHVTQLARFDSLTKLANRFQMAEWLQKILESPREDQRACTIFLLDLDRFKQVNDTMGHPAGDALLRQVADRLNSTVASAGSVGRLGGDEFQVILPGKRPVEELGHLAHRIIENLSQPYSLDGARVTIGASVGIAMCPEHGTDSEHLIRNADLALYAAKDGGRGRYHFYASDLHSEAEERRALEQELRDAITNGDLELHYQPQVALKSETISGFEALLRWNHPRHGYISPDRFVPVAEESGLVTQIGEWALREACRQLAVWPPSIRVAVNVSPLQFANPALPAIITNAIAGAQIDPARLELEITESVFLNDDKSTDGMFSALKRVGVRLALDDFGTGYSSLGYLKKAPFDKIKIDQSFVRGATMAGSRNGAIISSIVNLAETLGMETTAEGVETLDELALVRKLGCSHVQGYIYEKALTGIAAGERLAKGLAATAHGPQSARAPRQTMLRKVTLEHGGHSYDGTIRNISVSGAMIEGLWNVPPGTTFDLHLAAGYVIKATSRWSDEDRMGVQFGQPLEQDANGAISFAPPTRPLERGESRLLRKAG